MNALEKARSFAESAEEMTGEGSHDVIDSFATVAQAYAAVAQAESLAKIAASLVLIDDSLTQLRTVGLTRLDTALERQASALTSIDQHGVQALNLIAAALKSIGQYGLTVTHGGDSR